jgi:hypothetical protein
VSNKKQQLLPPPSGRHLPATVLSKPSLPSLPTGNAWLGPAYRVYDRNRRTVEASANYLRARADQAQACVDLVRAREELAIAISRLAALPERCVHEYEKGRLDRLNELRLLRLQHELDETNARIALVAAQTQLASYTPQPPDAPPPPPSAAPVGLSPSEVEELVRASLPEVSADTLRTLGLLLSGRLAEKRS